LSRLRFLFALAALIALATALSACGGGSSSKSGENPQQVVDEATLQGIESGNVDLALGIVAAGNEGGNIDLSLSGPFQGQGKGNYPQFDLAAKAAGKVNGEAVDFNGGLTLLPNTAFVDYQGTEYEVDPTTFSFVEAALKKAERHNGSEGESGLTACQEEAGKLKISSFMENLSNEGSAEVGGTGTTKISGDLNVAGGIDSLLELVEGPACKAQLGAAGPLPSKPEIERVKGEISGAVKTAHADVYVGEDDIVRQISAQLKVEPKSPGSGPKSVELNLALKLTGVNEEQQISAPANSKPLSDLFAKLGVNPIELLGVLQGQGGAAGLGNLIEGLAGGSGGKAGGQQAYLNCISGAKSAADLQKCTAKLG
jgi:hypothetical protein